MGDCYTTYITDLYTGRSRREGPWLGKVLHTAPRPPGQACDDVKSADVVIQSQLSRPGGSGCDGVQHLARDLEPLVGVDIAVSKDGI